MSGPKGFDKLNGYELIGRFYTRGLQDLITQVYELQRPHGGGSEDYNSKRIDELVTQIQDKVDELSGKNVGGKISRKDVTGYVQKKMIDRE